MNSENKKLETRIHSANQLYLSGDFKAAFRLYKELAEKGVSSCQRFIGWMYFGGEGTDRDLDQALSWLIKSATKGDPEAEFGVGRVYVAKKDYARA